MVFSHKMMGRKPCLIPNSMNRAILTLKDSTKLVQSSWSNQEISCLMSCFEATSLPWLVQSIYTWTQSSCSLGKRLPGGLQVPGSRSKPCMKYMHLDPPLSSSSKTTPSLLWYFLVLNPQWWRLHPRDSAPSSWGCQGWVCLCPRCCGLCCVARGPGELECKEKNHFIEDSTMMDLEVGFVTISLCFVPFVIPITHLSYHFTPFLSNQTISHHLWHMLTHSLSYPLFQLHKQPQFHLYIPSHITVLT